MIHLRAVGDGINNYRDFLDQIFLALRPGGVLLVVEWDFQIRNEDGEPIMAENELEPVGEAHSDNPSH